MTWTPPFLADDLDPTTGTNPVFHPVALCPAIGTDTSLPPNDRMSNFQLASIQNTYLQLQKPTFNTTMPVVSATVTSAFTVAACYCPSFDYTTGLTCTSTGNQATCCKGDARAFYSFIQPFGRIYYWMVKICDYDNYQSCRVPYMRVIPHQKFVIVVTCPPGGGCTSSYNSRVKFLAPLPVNDVPSWSLSSGCATNDKEASSAIWQNSASSMAKDGGLRVDYKAWYTDQVKFRLSTDQALDICYTNTNTGGVSWFKVGTIRTSQRFGLAGLNENNVSTIRYVSYPGSVTLWGGTQTDVDSNRVPVGQMNPLEGQKYSGQALINIISYDRKNVYGVGNTPQTIEQKWGFDQQISLDFQAKMDLECQRVQYVPDFVDGPNTASSAKQWAGQLGEQSPSRKTSFSGLAKDRTISLSKSGVVAICYCAHLRASNDPNVPGDCFDSGSWLFAGRITIRGPIGNIQYILPTDIVLGFQLTGWGMSSSDRLRIVPANATCLGSPPSDTSFKVSCPFWGGVVCQQAVNTTLLNLYTAASDNSDLPFIFIANATSDLYQTTLIFSSSLYGILQDKDIITIDYNSILVNGNAEADRLAQHLQQDQYSAYQLSGYYQYGDAAATLGVNPSTSYIVGHRITFVSSGGVTDYTRATIPLGFALPPVWSFTNGKGYWRRTNTAYSREELKATQPTDPLNPLKLCWGVQDPNPGPFTGTNFYYSMATIVFQDPPQMESASLSLTTAQQGVIAPVIISFRTNSSQVAYANASGMTMLMMRWLDVADSGRLVPVFTGDNNPDRSVTPQSIINSQSVPKSNIRQSVCGQLFAELWSDDSEGFPLPAGCYFLARNKDDRASNYYREFYIVFNAYNGLKQGVNYQIVLNVQQDPVMGTMAGDHVLDIFTGCHENTGCQRPYMIFEKAAVQATSSTEPPPTLGTSNPTYTPLWGPNGVQVQRGLQRIDNILNFTLDNVLQLMLVGGTNLQTSIKAQYFIRLYLWPLTAWNTATCSAVCVPYFADTKRCDQRPGAIACTTDTVVSGSNRNVVKLRMPVIMDDIISQITHTVKVTGLAFPSYGFFPTRIGAQVTNADDLSPAYTTSTGMWMHNTPIGSTTGRIVISSRSGSGTAPFIGDKGNVVFVRIQMGATLWTIGGSTAQNQALKNGQLGIVLPNGFTCVPPPTVPEAMPDFSLPVFSVDGNSDGYFDNQRGRFNVNSDDGDWNSSASDTCTYTLRPGSAIWAGMVVYARLIVNNPDGPLILPRADLTNVWYVKLSSVGFNMAGSAAYDMSQLRFISRSEERDLGNVYWASNIAVISPLAKENIQPDDLTRSLPVSLSPNMNSVSLRIFFYVGEEVGQNGFVVLDAPDTFDFGVNCTAGDLAPSYYATSSALDVLNPLRNKGSCVGSKFPPEALTFNRAKFQVGGNILPNSFYGFSVKVTHPRDWDPSLLSGWYLWTQDANGWGLQGSRLTIPFYLSPTVISNPQFWQLSYGLYVNPLPNLKVTFGSMMPYSVSQVRTFVQIGPLRFPVSIDTSMRVTSPLLFVWGQQIGDFKGTIAASSRTLAAPARDNDNQLVWTNVTFVGAETYGFQYMLTVPDYSPFSSSNSFFVEVGYRTNLSDYRYFSQVIDAPPVQTITNAAVSYESNLAGYQNNFIEFAFQLTTPMTSGAGLVIRGNVDTADFQFGDASNGPITYVPLSSDPPFPDDFRLLVKKAQDNTPQIVLKAIVNTFLPGFYRFQLPCFNPPGVVLNAGKWTFGSYQTVDNYPSVSAAPVIDKAIVVDGFVISGQMTDAGFLTLSEARRTATGRNDRPGQPNSVVLRFKLKNTPQDIQMMKIRAPRGFIFDENCLPGLYTSKMMVLGPASLQFWPTDTCVEWPQANAPTRCDGSGRVATLTVPVGLIRSQTYCFRIGVRSNPMQTPSWNRWSFDFNNEVSQPFPGFTIWTMTQISIASVTQAKTPPSQTGSPPPTLVSINFVPYNSIPARALGQATGGMLRVVAPPGFNFFGTGGALSACTVNLFPVGGAPFLPAQYQCLVDAGQAINVAMTSDLSIQGGTLYTLIASVFNPVMVQEAGTWLINSYRSVSATDQTVLDISNAPGYPIYNVLNFFSVINVANVLNGLTLVPTINITLRFPDYLKDLDVIEIYGPQGFNLIGNAATGECNSFRFPGGLTPLPNTNTPKCQCSNITVCKIIFNVLENKDPAMDQNTTFNFAIACTNPTSTPFQTANFWRAVHSRPADPQTPIRSQAAVPSWTINPQLQNVQVSLVGANTAAGKISNIQVMFTPVTNADVVQIEAVQPDGFDFTRATVTPPYVPTEQTAGPRLVLQRAGLVANTKVTIQINSVVLGRGGGQTMWNLLTYLDNTMTTQLDSKLNFTANAFRLPGVITVVNTPLLQSKYAVAAASYPVQSLFAARVGEDAQATFMMTFSQTVYAGQMLVVSCQGVAQYTLSKLRFQIIGSTLVNTQVSLRPQGELQAILKPGMPPTEVALQAGATYTVIFWAVPISGANVWRFDTEDSGSLPSNTNDASTPGFAPVVSMMLAIFAARSPPSSIVTVTLNIVQGNLVVQSLVVIAPPGFVFQSGPNGCGNMCMPGQALGATGRRTASIASPTGQPLVNLKGLNINVKTPQQQPSSLDWFVESVAAGSGATNGWGQGSGFNVVQMGGTSVSYGAVAGIKQTLITFTFTLSVDAGSVISVTAPLGFLLTCSAEGAFRQISLPGTRPACVDDPLLLTLSTVLTAGSYAFGIAVDVPPQTPAINTFDLQILDQDQAVVDAIFGMEGLQVMNISAGGPSISWSRSDGGQATLITMGLTFSQPTVNIKVMLISLPETFVHNIQKPTDVLNFNKQFPLSSGLQWADASYMDRVRIMLDDTNGGAIIPPGTYQFSFPALVPLKMPPNNVWRISLCNDPACNAPTQSSVVVSFPLAGFALGEVASQDLAGVSGTQTLTAGSHQQRPPILCGVSFHLLVALFALLCNALLHP